ncbi:MerR family transcriptional regulator [Nocardioides houyundeii]|uniref:MerR family transcriptional regulator n=1 Tax=Nocardioides houyundeii TaxID=2045452 RepID=UPI000C76CE4F|nr:MerR family transcriptional regulator [Nocardioides houyundeii]
MNIGELSTRSGVSPRSLRYYEQQGLVTPQRALNGYRQYAESDVVVVQTIRVMYEIGFSREAVSAVLPCATGKPDEVDPVAVRARVESMCEDLGARIDDLTRTRALLVDFLQENASTGCSAEGAGAWTTSHAKRAG